MRREWIGQKSEAKEGRGGKGKGRQEEEKEKVGEGGKRRGSV